MTDACIFCGKRPTTNAHIFRKGWTKMISPSAEAFRHRRGSSIVFIKSVVDEKVKSACGNCNSGWMEKLDLAAEETFLTNAALGYPARLSTMAEKQTVARWCAMVGTLNDQRSKSPCLPRRVHREIMEGGVPVDCHVWLFNTEPPESRDIIWGAGRQLTVEWADRDTGETHVEDFYFAFFGIKHLVVQVGFSRERTPSGVKFWSGGEGGGPMTRLIWPMPLTPIIWPPAQTVHWDDALDLPNKLERAGRKP